MTTKRKVTDRRKSLRTFAVEVEGPKGILRINVRQVRTIESARRIVLNAPENRRRLREIGITNAKQRKAAELSIGRVTQFEREAGLA